MLVGYLSVSRNLFVILSLSLTWEKQNKESALLDKHS